MVFAFSFNHLRIVGAEQRVRFDEDGGFVIPLKLNRPVDDVEAALFEERACSARGHFLLVPVSSIEDIQLRQQAWVAMVSQISDQSYQIHYNAKREAQDREELLAQANAAVGRLRF